MFQQVISQLLFGSDEIRMVSRKIDKLARKDEKMRLKMKRIKKKEMDLREQLNALCDIAAGDTFTNDEQSTKTERKPL